MMKGYPGSASNYLGDNLFTLKYLRSIIGRATLSSLHGDDNKTKDGIKK